MNFSGSLRCVLLSRSEAVLTDSAYEPGDADSIAQAIQAAMRQGKHKPGHYLSWADVAKRVVNPGAYPDTPLLPADGRVALSRAVA